MASKERRTFSLDEDNDEWLADQDNASAVVNRLVDQARQNGGTQGAAIDLNIEQKERELKNARQNVERLESEIEELRELRQQVTQQETADIERAREALAGAELNPSNPAVENWATKLEMTPAELVAELR